MTNIELLKERNERFLAKRKEEELCDVGDEGEAVYTPMQQDLLEILKGVTKCGTK